MQKTNKQLQKQKGVALILMTFIIGLGVIAYLLHALDPQRLKLEQDKKTYESLNAAKQALIAWSVSHKYTPGQMPWPDRNADGSSDCVTTPFQYIYLLGQLPSKPDTSPCLDPNNGSTSYAGLSSYPSLGQEFRDAGGNRLWYAVSRNLVYDSEHNESPIINPGMINPPYAVTPYLRQGGTQPYTWLRVLDRNGNLVSDRVAVVIIAPGEPVGGQNRAAIAPGASEFLDSFKIGIANYKNSDSAIPDEDFIMGEDSRTVPVSDPTFVQPYYFNDKLVYITIDELMAALEKRAAAEVKVAVKNYKLSTGYNPYAAIMGGDKNYSCVAGKLAGALPIAPSHTSSCSYTGVSGTSSTSSCSFTEVASVIFNMSSNFTGNAGACQYSANVCTCNGAGSCTNAAQTFTCNAAGACSANIAGTYKFSEGGFDSVTGNCTTTCGSDTSCAGLGSGSFAHSSCADSSFNSVTTNSKLPTWFTNNLWQDYIYYAAQRGASPTLNAGGRSGITALTITTGYPIISAPLAVSKGSPQLRLSCNLADHMDTSVNATGDITNIYEPLNKPKGQNYNDQIFVISP